MALADLATQEPEKLSEIENELLTLRKFKMETELREIEGKKNGFKISEVIKKWHTRDKQGERTKYHYRQYLSEFTAQFGDIYVGEITKLQIVQFIDNLQIRNKRDGGFLASTSVTKRLECVKAMLAFCESTDLVPHNVARGVKPPRDVGPKTLRSRAVLTK